LTDEALKVADRLIDVIAKAKKGKLVAVEIVCPDGKTSFKVELREKEIEQKMKNMLGMCSQDKRP
jgi:hypothetical protein